MRALAASFLVALSAALACSPAADDAGEGESAVVGGSASTAHPAVGYLVRDGSASCTGTLIEPTVVLTAAHCVEGVDEVAFGWGQVDEGKTVRVRAVASHPRYLPPTVDAGLSIQGFDIALLELEAAPPLEPMPLGPTPRSGKVLGLGYGSNVYERDDAGVYRASGAGRERKAALGVVMSLNPVEVFVRFDGTGTVCYGDSGGPLLEGGKVTGTLSRFVQRPSCRPESRSLMAYTRVEGMTPFFAAAKACFRAADVAACLREDYRQLCITPRMSNAPAAVRPSTGDEKDGSFTFELRNDEGRTIRLPAFAARTKVSFFAQGDARATAKRGDAQLGVDMSELTVDPGGALDVVLRSCNGASQGVTVIWAPAP